VNPTDLRINTVDPHFAERISRRKQSDYPELWNTLDKVFDPELPGLTLWDLGILQDIKKTGSTLLVEITLTYSGCPAVGVMKQDIIKALQESGVKQTIEVAVVLSPAWTTDWISPAGKQQLRDLNIAPPVEDEADISCPICHSKHIKVISEFGSTACKALYQCTDCLEPFDYFKSF